jgi:hypothetical protein
MMFFGALRFRRFDYDLIEAADRLAAAPRFRSDAYLLDFSPKLP